jgi:hypothetical protein
MRIVSFILGILTVIAALSFLYFGNIIESFHEEFISKILGIIAETSLVLSAILFIIIMIKEKKYLYMILTLICLSSYIGHLLIIITIGFQKTYSYGMDVLITVIYLIILVKNYDIFFKLKSDE